ncbi:hypothetical protein [Sulfitobacter sp. S190]|uniref:hypothetical protein n=1 Tax=Sulfitobacter sp. S190 TaxID=2867022 RepID=UPI0021A31285|nr:hypothetical protein [Sulfitobacter sp. S190]UWR23093.1 hypothetical protein K3756_03595 [Sulfitobacter sp. S190]
MKTTILIAAIICSAGIAQACTSVAFVEGAPRDRFVLSDAQEVAAVTVDLRGSAGRLIFDTADGGTGVEVFQPLRDEGGTTASSVLDGAEVIRVVLDGSSADGRAAFSIDVDDRLEASDLGQIRVTGGELEGASVTFETRDGDVATATFGANNRASACLS